MNTEVRISTSLCLLLALACRAATVYVDNDGPADFDSIQAAIDAVNEGDAVIVKEGVYLENIHFKGKNIVLSSMDPTDPVVVAATIIDGGHLDSAVTFAGTENAHCVLSGFAIRHGYQDLDVTQGGGGICGGSETEHTHATIAHNAIIRNFAWDAGDCRVVTALSKRT